MPGPPTQVLMDMLRNRRGLLPRPTYSAHWLAHPGFSEVIEEFLSRESQHMRHYMDELNEHNPFKSHPE